MVVSYAYNCGFNKPGVGPNSNHYQMTLAQQNQPSKEVLLFEVEGNNSNVTNPLETDSPSGNGYPDSGGLGGQGYGSTLHYVTGYMGNDSSQGPSNPSQYPIKTGLHTDGSNFLFCDGHVKWLRGSAVSFGTTPQSATDLQDENNGYNSDGSQYCAAGTSTTNFTGAYGTGTISATFSTN